MGVKGEKRKGIDFLGTTFYNSFVRSEGEPFRRNGKLDKVTD